MYSSNVGGVLLTSCSDGGDGGSTSFTSSTKEVVNDAATLGAKTTVVESGDTAKATVAFKDDDKSAIVITSKAAGEVTIKAKENADASDYATIKAVIAADGKITATVTRKVGEQAPDQDVVYRWTFNNITKTDVAAENAGGDYDGKLVLVTDYKYKSTPEGLVLTMGKGDASKGFVYNKIDEAATVGESSQTEIYGMATVGAVEPAGDLLTLKNLTGPFTVTVYVSSNSSSDKTDRYAYIKAGKAGEEAEVIAPTKNTTTVPVAGQILIYTYAGTDKINVIIGCEKYLRVYDVFVTTSVKQDQSDGTPVTFTPATQTVENTLDKLGLIGASAASANTAIAKAEKTDAGISVTSVAEGNTTITVTDANSKTASFKAIVAENGALTIGTITKFTRSAPTAEVTKKASSNSAKDGAGKVTWDGLTDLEYSTDGETFVSATAAGLTVTVDGTTATITGLGAGTYYVRGAASTAYTATEKATVTVGNAAADKTTDSWALTGENNIVGKSVTGFFYYKKSNSEYPVIAATTIPNQGDKSGSIDFGTDGGSTTNNNIYTTLSEAITINGASGNLVLTMADYKGTGYGTTKVGSTAALPESAPVVLTSEPKVLAYRANTKNGLVIKKDALKISGVKGSVKMTISWYCASADTEAEKWIDARRMLEIMKTGDAAPTTYKVQAVGGTEESPGANGAKGAQADITFDIEGGSEGVDVYIGASNELYIKSIRIE